MKKSLVEYQLAPQSKQLLMPWHPGVTVSSQRAAKMLGCSSRTIHRMIEDGTLEAFKFRKTEHNNSPYRVIRDSILRVAEEWRIEAGAQRATPATSVAGNNAGRS